MRTYLPIMLLIEQERDKLGAPLGYIGTSEVYTCKGISEVFAGKGTLGVFTRLRDGLAWFL